MDGMSELASESWLICLAQNYGPLLTSGAILISATVAVGAIVLNGRSAKRRATIDLVLNQRQDQNLVKARKKVLELHEGNTQFFKYALLEHAGSEENEAILIALNTHEFVAAGIREGAFDEKTYKRLRCQVLIRDWDALATYVAEFRRTRNRQTLFKEFEWLATKWKADPLKVDD